eukprot:SAG11_NODE_23206_length_393_cov_0.877551_1_plen_58_part_10
MCVPSDKNIHVQLHAAECISHDIGSHMGQIQPHHLTLLHLERVLITPGDELRRCAGQE